MRNILFVGLELTVIHSEDVFPAMLKHLVTLVKVFLKLTFYREKEKKMSVK